MSSALTSAVRIAAAAILAAAVLGFRATDLPSAPYAPRKSATPLDTLRVKARPATVRGGSERPAVGAVIPGYLSSRGLPPVQGRLTVTDTGLVFRSAAGLVVTLPLVGPVRETGGRRWRASAVSLVYMSEASSRPVYVFRVDAGVFETQMPGPLLDVAAHPAWLESVAPTEWSADTGLVDGGDPVAIWKKNREVAASAYADSLYTLFGRPSAPVGIIGERGRTAGRLGEYVRTRDSLALDPARMTGEPQLRHTLAHELGHRWQNRAPQQVEALWWGIPPIRDPKRYGYADESEHQAEAIAFAVDYLQTTAGWKTAAGSMSLLEHYELLVPGTRTMARYLAMQPIYQAHPLRLLLTRGT